MKILNRPVTFADAERVLEVVDKGLCNGLGRPVPGQMCVEAAVCYALGLAHGDDPSCVNSEVRGFKITLNDQTFTSNAARAIAMRRLAVAQLGTDDTSFDVKAFRFTIVEQTIRIIVPVALRAAASMKGNVKFKAELEEAAVECEIKGTVDSANAANKVAAAAYAYANAAAAANAAADAAASPLRDKILGILAEIGVMALRAAGAKGIEWMDKLIPDPVSLVFQP